MKAKRLFISCVALIMAMAAWADVEINETNFPDANFRSWLLSQSYGKDGVLTAFEMSNLKTISVSEKGIQNLKGIEYFTALTQLHCGGNQLTALDVSMNTKLVYLYCWQNQLTELDVSKNTALTKLYCEENQLTALDVSKNTALTGLHCGFNPLTELDVSQNTELTDLACDAGQLTALDISKNTKLIYLHCGGNPLAELDVSQNTALSELWCYENQLTVLDVSKNAVLSMLLCSGNQLTALDVSKNTALTELSCESNQLTELDVSMNTKLTRLDCFLNHIKGAAMDALTESLPTVSNGTMYVIYNTNEQNVMTTTQVAAAKAKRWIPKYYDGSNWQEYVGSESVTDAIAVNEENFPDENFRNWVLAQNYGKDGVLTDDEIMGITSINVRGKKIQRLKGIEFFTAMKTLNCSQNQLTELDMTKNTALTELQCYQNQIKGAAMDALVESLPIVSSGKMRVIYNKGEQNEMTLAQAAAAKAKGWTPYEYDGGWLIYGFKIEVNEENFPDANFRSWILSQEYGKDGVLREVEIASITHIGVSNQGIQSMKGIEFFTALKSMDCSGNRLTTLELSKNTALKSMNCSFNLLTTLDVSNNTALESLASNVNQLTTLDVSNNTALIDLGCENNLLTTLDMSKNAALEFLSCSFNQLTALDVSKSTALTELHCEDNQLTTLDVSNNTALVYIDCFYNQLTVLDVSKNTKLTNLWCSCNQLTTLDVSHNTALVYLSCYANQLKALDLSKNTALKWLSCFNNQLTALEVSHNTALTDLYCYNNQLTALDVSHNTALKELSCFQNQIKGARMDALVESLPTVSSGTMYVINNENEQNIMTTTQVAGAKAKGWTPQYYDGSDWQEYSGSEPVIQDYATLTYAAGGQSTMQMTVKTGEVTLCISPEEHWAVETLTVNKTDKLPDLTDGKLTVNVVDDTEVRVTFCWANAENLYFEDYATGVATIAGENVKVFIIDGQLCIEGAAGKAVRLYTMSGALIKTVTPRDSEKVGVFSLPAGTYIVQVGNKAAKISVR